jgi:acetyl esterase/lipase
MDEISRRTLTKGLAAVTVSPLIPAKAVALNDGVPHESDLWYVHPDLRPVARQVLDGHAMDVIAKAMAHAPKASPSIIARVVPASGQSPSVTVYVINAHPGAARPAILHMHGGGFVAGSAKHSAVALQDVAEKLDCVIVSVEYRLAPATTFAGSLEDDYAALRWLHGNAAELGADPDRIAVMGESAGGTHAALLTFIARERGEVPILFQLLNYAALDDRTGITVIPPKPIGAITIGGGGGISPWRAFLGEEPATDGVPAHAVPLRQKDLKDLPPAFIGVGSIDLLVGENIDYARRLIEAGIPTELIVVPGAFHGFDGFAADTPVAKWYTAAKLDALRRAFARS